MNAPITNSPESGLRLCATIAALFAAVHVVRLVGRVDMSVGRHRMPMATSVAAAAGGAMFSAWLWRLSSQAR